ncbi:hypothetical protein [Lysobacter sp. ESA13C]|uniref:hypothetical protein n=1 Tax=Lysobacter sp. ESA13C TaxID=2862676 RepID=UPI001CC17DE6|nr:hypothetical protein [Lysobacter sp. ESA13C]
MASRFGHTWTSQFGDSPDGIAGRAWNEDLAGLTRAQLNAGIDAVKFEAAEFPPSAPRFRAMCFGIPSFSLVNSELLTKLNAQRTPFARLVWRYIDGYSHRHATSKEAEKMRRAAYELAAQHVMRGEAFLDEPVAEIEHQPEPKPQGIPKTREERIEHMRKVLGEQFNEEAALREVRV